MTSDQIVTSWKNEEYRLSLSNDEQALLPDNPAGLIELSDEVLLGAAGATGTLLTGIISAITPVLLTLDTCPVFCLIPPLE